MKQNLLFDRILPPLELVGWLIAAIGLGMRWALILSGEIILIIGLMQLGVVYMLFAYAPTKFLDNPDLASVEPAHDENQSVVINTIARQLVGFGAAFLFMGVLFKLRFWSGGPKMLLAGTLTVGIGQLVLSSVGRLSRKYLLVIALGVTAISTTPQAALVGPFHHNDPVLAQLLLYRLHHPRDRSANEAVQQYLLARRK